MLRSTRLFTAYTAPFVCALLLSCGGDSSSSQPEDTSTTDATSNGTAATSGGTTAATSNGATTGEACLEGDEGCPCYRNATCNAGQRCREADMICESCPPGEEACACDEDRCGEGLVCVNAVCALEDCQNSPGLDGCPCDTEGSCEDGLTCTEGGMCAPCSPDLPGCPCDDQGACLSDLICDDDEVVCREARTCEDLECAPEQLCEEEPGEDAACIEACAPGFVWNPEAEGCDVVIMANCVNGAEGSILTQCAAQNRRCEDGAGPAMCGGCLSGYTDEGGALCRPIVTCSELSCDGLNRLCVSASDHDDAFCGACDVGYQEGQGGACVPVANCREDALGSILVQCLTEGRTCVEADTNASCGVCLEGYVEDNRGACVPEVRCAELDCADRGRTCAGDPLAACGSCLPGTLLSDPNDPDSDCREPVTCNDTGNVCTNDGACLVGRCYGASGCAVGDPGCDDTEGTCGCAAGSFCSNGEGRDATCSSWPCTDVNGDPVPTEAYNPSTGRCADCSIPCGAEGETGGLWPFTERAKGRCICETEPGYYADISGAIVTRPCDADADGWVRSSARSAVESDDLALSTNARCDVRTIDRVVLENEWRQQRPVLLCVEGEVAADPCTTNAECGLGRCFGSAGVCGDGEEGCVCGCIEAREVPLYESVRNDDQNRLDVALESQAPSYSAGGQGRRLRVEELNGLTRACVSETADFNHNGLEDALEWHNMEPSAMGVELSADELLFLKFSFFTELHRGWYERDLGAAHGRYILQERSRCEEGFPLVYDDALDGDYWRSCTRNRDTAFDSLSENPMIGFDFAQWSCDQEQDTCPALPPAAEMSAEDEVPLHGLCDVSLPPADGVWRGMNHHSQFKCAVIDDLPPFEPEKAPHIVQRSELTDTLGEGAVQFNRCFADSSASPGGELDNPYTPDVTCLPITRSQVTSDEVGFVAVRYGELAYERGCINEWNNWPELCPGYTDNPEAVRGAAHTNNFGELICGCSFNYGGPGCRQGCADTQLQYGGQSGEEAGVCDNGYCSIAEEDEGRSGWWMCSSVVSSLPHEPDTPPFQSGGAYTLEGQVRQNMLAQEGPMCQDEGCGQGWVIR